MFGKVSDDSYQSIFEGSSFDDNARGSSSIAAGPFSPSPYASSLRAAAAAAGSNSSNLQQQLLSLQQAQQGGSDLFSQRNPPLFNSDASGHNFNKRRQQQQQPIGKLGLPAQQQQQQQPGGSNRYKTELCRPFQDSGHCKYGDKCQFAHGHSELRSISRHPKYKTDLCRTYHSTGFCPYGPRCHFVHNLDEAKPKPGASNGTSCDVSGASSPVGSLGLGGPSPSSATASPAANGMPPLPMFHRGPVGPANNNNTASDFESSSSLLKLHLNSVGAGDAGYFSSSSSSSTSSSAGQSPSYASSLADFDPLLDSAGSSISAGDRSQLLSLTHTLQQLQQMRAANASSGGKPGGVTVLRHAQSVASPASSPGRLPVFSTISK